MASLLGVMMHSQKYDQLADDQRELVQEATLAIMKIKSDMIARLGPIGGFDGDDFFPIPCTVCSCPDFVGKFGDNDLNPKCQRQSPPCDERASLHRVT